MTQKSEQTLLWQQRTNQQLFAELCNALYERELARLANDSKLDLKTLQKRLSSLPYYIKKAAGHISDLYTPLDLDTQNGSWIAAQAVKPFSMKLAPEKTHEFYYKYAKMALVTPISVRHSGIEQVVLDSIDEISVNEQKLHCNEHGWFHFDGSSEEQSPLVNKVLLKPSKPAMAAACCGHQWLNTRRTSPRLLSLREMLLATRINWRQFSKLMVIKK